MEGEVQSMIPKHVFIFLLMVSSMIFCFFNDSYAMALIFVASAGLLSFLEFNERRNENQIKELRDQIKQLSTRVDQISLSRKMGR